MKRKLLALLIGLIPLGVAAQQTAQANLTIRVNRTVVLTWNAPAPNNGPAITGYEVYRGTTNGGPYNAITGEINQLDYNDLTATTSGTYYYVVTAVDAQGVQSTFSNQATAIVP